MKDPFRSLSKTELENMRHEVSAGIGMVRTAFKKRAMFDPEMAAKIFDTGLSKLTKALSQIDARLSMLPHSAAGTAEPRPQRAHKA